MSVAPGGGGGTGAGGRRQTGGGGGGIGATSMDRAMDEKEAQYNKYGLTSVSVRLSMLFAGRENFVNYWYESIYWFKIPFSVAFVKISIIINRRVSNSRWLLLRSYFFYNSKNMNCIGVLSFLLLRLEEEYWRSPFLNQFYWSDFEVGNEMREKIWE